MTVADYDDHDNKKADDSDMGCVATAACSGRRQAWQATDHFERLLEEACPNHTYQIKHKLKDYDMMKNFMTSVSLTRGRPEQILPMPFLREVAVTTVYDGRPPPGRHRMSILSLRTCLTTVGDPGHRGLKAEVFQYLNV
jgi:hypothetical protein